MRWKTVSCSPVWLLSLLIVAAVTPPVMADENPQVAVNGVAPPASQTATSGSTVAVTVTDGPGNTTDWVGLYRAGSTDQQYLDWRYLNGSTTPPTAPSSSGTVLFLLPSAPGDYEVRLYSNNSYVRVATSGTITVVPSTCTMMVNGNLPPSPVAVTSGTFVDVIVAAGPGNPTDWVGLFAQGAPDSAYLTWQYLNGSTSPPASGVQAATLRFGVPTVPGTYELRLFAGGGFTRVATSTGVVVSASAATLTVNGVAAPGPVLAGAGTMISVTVSGGPANMTDWVGLYRVGAADTSYVDWRYLSGTTTPPPSGLAAGVIAFLGPTSPGDYEFRFFARNGYERLATSGVVTIPASSASIVLNGVAPPGIATAAGGTLLSVAIAGGPANASDWVGIYAAGANDTQYLGWQYLNGSTGQPATGLSSATVEFLVPITPGSYEVRFFANGGYGRVATSPALLVTEPTARLAVNGVAPPQALVLEPAATVTVAIEQGPGHSTDWVGLYTIVAPDSQPIRWQYLGGGTTPPVVGLTSASLTFTLPDEGGSYDFRFFARNAYMRLATSSRVETTQTAVTIVLTEPFAGTTFRRPVTIRLQATATVVGGAISTVEFYQGTSLLGSDATAPYETEWPGMPVGTYSLTAVAVNATGNRWTSAPVAITISDESTGFGVLGPPVAVPASGAFGQPQVVTLTAAAGTTIRYTLDGTEPNDASSEYTVPLQIATDSTLMARAYQVGWTPSPVLSAAFVIDTEPPTVTIAVSPPSTPHGWNNTDVKARFVCADTGSGVAHCPEPVTVTGETGGQGVSGAATDHVGNTTTAIQTVRIDRTSPIVTLTAPADGITIADAEIVVTAAVADSLSGVAGAWCNGQPATVTEGEVSCVVPLRLGRNSIVVSAKDAAGNSSSSGIRVGRIGLRTSIVITPTSATMGVGQARTFRVVDEYGLPLADATWTVDDPAKLSQTADPSPVFRALFTGQVQVTATWQSLSVSATVTIVDGVSLPPGTPAWTLPALPGDGWNRLVYANRVASEVPDAYLFEGGMVRGVNASGEEVWTEVPAMSPGSSWVDQVVGDSLGGVLLRTTDYNIGSYALVRVPGPTNSAPWRWESPYRVERDVAQAPDGTIFVLERTDDGYTLVAGVDGATGHTRFRHRVAGVTKYTTLNHDCTPGFNFESESGPYTTSLVVGADGAAYLSVQSETQLRNYLPCGSGSGTQQVSVELLRVDSSGGVSSQIFHSVDQTLAAGAADQQVVVDQVLPEEGGGVLATWSINPYAEDGQHLATYVRGSAVTTYARPSGAPVQMVGGDGVALTTGSGDTLTAFDLASGGVRWSLATWGQPIAALADGGAAVVTDGTLYVVDGAGQADAGVVMPPATLRYWGVGTWLGYDGLTLTGLAGLEIDEALVSFNADGGNPQGQRALPAGYKTKDLAAITALRVYNPVSIMVDSEFGGSICRLPNGRYFPSGPAINFQFSDSVANKPCPPREPWSKVGEYHTHGTSGQEDFSTQDRNRVDHAPYFASYLATPCGFVHAYQGPLPGLDRRFIGSTDSFFANNASCRRLLPGGGAQ